MTLEKELSEELQKDLAGPSWLLLSCGNKGAAGSTPRTGFQISYEDHSADIHKVLHTGQAQFQTLGIQQ